MARGLKPKTTDTAGFKTLSQHVTSGSKKGFESQLISGTASLRTAASWSATSSKESRIAVVQLHDDDLRADLNREDTRKKSGMGNTAQNFAKSSKEVVVPGSIPKEKIRGVYTVKPMTVKEYKQEKAKGEVDNVTFRRHRIPKDRRGRGTPKAMKLTFTPNPDFKPTTTTTTTTTTPRAGGGSPKEPVFKASTSKPPRGGKK